jgi:hypothetical protein
MTNDRMALAELLEKGSDGNVLCEMIGYVAQRLMDVVILESLALLSENPPIRLAAATTALDSTADELRLELLFPSDEATTRFLGAGASGRADA